MITFGLRSFSAYNYHRNILKPKHETTLINTIWQNNSAPFATQFCTIENSSFQRPLQSPFGSTTSEPGNAQKQTTSKGGVPKGGFQGPLEAGVGGVSLPKERPKNTHFQRGGSKGLWKLDVAIYNQFGCAPGHFKITFQMVLNCVSNGADMCPY